MSMWNEFITMLKNLKKEDTLIRPLFSQYFYSCKEDIVYVLGQLTAKTFLVTNPETYLNQYIVYVLG